MAGKASCKMQLNQNALAYSATTVAATMMNSVFQFYYVNLFINVYRITDTWFNNAQLIYLVWNAINDPLFGYFQDHSNISFLKHRRLNILYGAPFFALSFLLPWFGWAANSEPDWLIGIHLTVSLCFYDAMFTFVVLAQCSLFAEISPRDEEKETVLQYSQAASIVGCSSVLFCEFFSDHMTKLRMLQGCCIVIAILSALLMRYSGRNVRPAVERGDEALLSMKEIDGNKGGSDETSLIKITKQIFSQRNFMCFVVMNFFQVFHTTFSSNFFGMFRDQFMKTNAISSTVKSLMAGSAFILPQAVVLLNGRMISKFGSYSLILWSFYLKVLLSVLMYAVGQTHVWILAAFMMTDTVLPSAAFSLFNFSVSDIIEEDSKTFKRRRPISSMIFGTNALVTKPAQSIAPMLVVYTLQKYGYQTGKAWQEKGATENTELQSVMFNLLCLIPACIGVVQIVVWRIYTLRKKA